MSKNKISVYGIYESNFCETKNLDYNFTEQYGVTIFEARKYCFEQAKSKLSSLLSSNEYNNIVNTSNIVPLWYGQVPAQDGYHLIYGHPGPDESKIDIVKYTTINGWFGATTRTCEKVYSIYYKPIYRVKEETNVNTPCQTEPMEKFTVQEKKVRDPSNIRDALLIEIERKRKD